MMHEGTERETTPRPPRVESRAESTGVDMEARLLTEPVVTPAPGADPTPDPFDVDTTLTADGDAEANEESERERGGGGGGGGSESDGGTQVIDDVEMGDDDVPDAEKEVRRLMRERRKSIAEMRRESSAASMSLPQSQSEDDEKRRLEERFLELMRQAEAVNEIGFQRKGSSLSSTASGEGSGAAGKRKTKSRQREEDEDAEIAIEALQDGVPRHYDSSPAFINGQMKTYQVTALNWLISRHDAGASGILADEMGLGKTLESISLLSYLSRVRGATRPYLIASPKSTLGNWANEFRRWAPFFNVVTFIGSKDVRAAMVTDVIAPGKFDVVVTSYEILVKHKTDLAKHRWKYIVIDEAHRIKNEKALLSRTVRKIPSEHRLLLTGTPLQNNLHELWALLNFLLPEVFKSSEDFDAWFAMEESDPVKQQATVDKLHKVLQPYILRRLKVEVERTLPPKKEVKLFVGLSKMQCEWYRKVLMKDLTIVTGPTSGATKVQKMQLMNLIIQLRKVCNHPYLFQGAEQGPQDGTTSEDIVTNSGKMVVLDKLLPRLRAQGSRVLVFCQMTRMMDILEDYLNMRDYPYARIDGNTSTEDRDRQISEFNAPGSDTFVFLLSTRAGGLGINLATADTVVLYDSDWNPQQDLQAQDRAHRIGQKKPVVVYRFVTEGTVEMKIVQRAEKKLHLDAVVIQQGRLAERTRKEEKEADKNDYLSMIRYGADVIFNVADGTIDDADIEQILRRGEAKTAALTDKCKEHAMRTLTFSGGEGVAAGGGDGQLQPDGEEMDYLQWDGVNWRDVRAGKIHVPIDAFELPKRDRPADLSEGRHGAKPKTPPARRIPRAPKQHALPDFQFHSKRLAELLEKERSAYNRRKSAAENNEPELPDYGELTEAEEAEKEELLAKGFNEWSRREYQAFVRGCEKFGRAAFEQIATEVATALDPGKAPKTADDMKRYSEMFWERWRELKDGDRAVRNIERGEEQLQRRERLVKALATKVAQYTDPWSQLRVVFRNGRGEETQFTDAEDSMLACAMHQCGVPNWDAVRRCVGSLPAAKFDWFLRSRTASDLGRRCEILLRVIDREINPDAEDLPSKRVRAKKPAAAANKVDGEEGKETEKTEKDKDAPPQKKPKKAPQRTASAAKNK